MVPFLVISIVAQEAQQLPRRPLVTLDETTEMLKTKLLAGTCRMPVDKSNHKWDRSVPLDFRPGGKIVLHVQYAFIYMHLGSQIFQNLNLIFQSGNLDARPSRIAFHVASCLVEFHTSHVALLLVFADTVAWGTSTVCDVAISHAVADCIRHALLNSM